MFFRGILAILTPNIHTYILHIFVTRSAWEALRKTLRYTGELLQRRGRLQWSIRNNPLLPQKVYILCLSLIVYHV